MALGVHPVRDCHVDWDYALTPVADGVNEVPVDDRRVALREGRLQMAAGVCYGLRGLIRGRPEERCVVQIDGVPDDDCNGVTLD